VSAIRGEEIEEWLRCNDVDNYCIIDDFEYDQFLFEQIPHFVQTSNNFEHLESIRGMGLTEECSEKAIRILNR
jgi:hypothetical protein